MKKTLGVLALCCASLTHLIPASSSACSISAPPPEGFPKSGATDVSTATKILISTALLGPADLEITGNGVPVPIERVEEVCHGYWRVVTGPLPALATIRVKLNDPEVEGEFLTEFTTAGGTQASQTTEPELVSLVLKQTHYVGRDGSAGCLFADDRFWADFTMKPSAYSDTPEADVLYKLTVAAKDGSASLDFCMTGERLRVSEWKGLVSSWGAMNTSLEYCGSLSALGRQDVGWQHNLEQVCTAVHTDQAWGCSSIPATALPTTALLAAAVLVRRRRT